LRKSLKAMRVGSAVSLMGFRFPAAEPGESPTRA
jgi:hypothetical protein